MASSSSTMRMLADIVIGLGAGGRPRRADLLITNRFLYQLSYTSGERGLSAAVPGGPPGSGSASRYTAPRRAVRPAPRAAGRRLLRRPPPLRSIHTTR